MSDGYLRIGEFSERVGVSPDLLRAWERRYHLLDPTRSDGGFRLYSDQDVARVRRMAQLLGEGLSAAEAARMAVSTTSPPVEVEPTPAGATFFEGAIARIHAAIVAFDELAAQEVLDDLVATFSLETVLREVVLPLLREVGERWEAGELSVAQEHFASNLLRGRLLAVARGWGVGSGRLVVLAAPPHEDHDLGLLVFGLAMWRQGWRITFLGANTPTEALQDSVRRVQPDLVVVAATEAERLEAVAPELQQLAAQTDLAVAGAGASEPLAARLGARYLGEDPVTAASVLSSPPGIGREGRAAPPR